MSPSLRFECDWLDQPTVADPLERKTWASLRIIAAGRAVTHLWDRQTSTERMSRDLPTFPLANWIVGNCWALLYEPNRSEEIPPIAGLTTAAQRGWLQRHCLRAADSGLLIPRVCIYSNGHEVCVQWVPDEPDAFPHMPGEFIGDGFVRLD